MFRCRTHHLQEAHYPCLLKSHFVKIVNYALPEDGVTAPKHVGGILM